MPVGREVELNEKPRVETECHACFEHGHMHADDDRSTAQ